MRMAVTGGTGFVGSHFVDAALAAGHEINALTRRPQPGRAGVTWIDGSLSDRDSLRRFVDHCDAVVHIAGILNARDQAGFNAGNVDGTLNVLAASTAGGIRRFVHVSSLAAREPKLSMYGASKARAEELVERSGLDWTMVRPPAVYGPGDRETLDLFAMAKRGIVLLPPRGRLSIIHVRDLARLLLALAEPDAPAKVTLEPDDGKPGGWSHEEFATALGFAVGRKSIRLSMPSPLLRLGAAIDQIIRRDRAKLTVDRAAYFCHPDWVVDPARAAPPELWSSQISSPEGLADTYRWYCEKGWL
ncbi:MAG TPA: NAD-dependent epimerase/dehydratase family protein [Sphingomicrobium sp.]|nr:NAD-dependent epimerase/dehydratase family protein [Sphingomicrobium sp.]